MSATVAPQPPTRPLRIATPAALVEVVGTRFRVDVAGEQTRVELAEGTLRVLRLADRRELILYAGQGAVIAAGNDLVARPLASLAAEDLSFPADGFAGWLPESGRWSNRDGIVRGEGADERARLSSVRVFADFELTCRMRIGGGVNRAEIQVGDYSWYFVIPKAADAVDDGWVPVRVFQRGSETSAFIGGGAAERGAGDAVPGRIGHLAFYVAGNGVAEIRDLRIRAPAAGR